MAFWGLFEEPQPAWAKRLERTMASIKEKVTEIQQNVGSILAIIPDLFADNVNLSNQIADLQAKLATNPPDDPELVSMVDNLATSVAGAKEKLDQLNALVPAVAPAEGGTGEAGSEGANKS